MDSLQKQIKDLSTKIDALYQVVEQLSQRISETSLDTRFVPDNVRPRVLTNYYQKRNGLSDNSMDHKDVLADEDNLDTTYRSGEKHLAPEIQIQRLTAQLTAAYNRIAALEEQLLAQRTH